MDRLRQTSRRTDVVSVVAITPVVRSSKGTSPAAPRKKVSERRYLSILMSCLKGTFYKQSNDNFIIQVTWRSWRSPKEQDTYWSRSSQGRLMSWVRGGLFVQYKKHLLLAIFWKNPVVSSSSGEKPGYRSPLPQQWIWAPRIPSSDWEGGRVGLQQHRGAGVHPDDRATELWSTAHGQCINTGKNTMLTLDLNSFNQQNQRLLMLPSVRSIPMATPRWQCRISTSSRTVSGPHWSPNGCMRTPSFLSGHWRSGHTVPNPAEEVWAAGYHHGS